MTKPSPAAKQPKPSVSVIRALLLVQTGRSVDSSASTARERATCERAWKHIVAMKWVDKHGDLNRAGAAVLAANVPEEKLCDYTIGLLQRKPTQAAIEEAIALSDKFGFGAIARYPSRMRNGRLAIGPGIRQLANMIQHVRKEAKQAARA